jgi:hypothetical protein
MNSQEEKKITEKDIDTLLLESPNQSQVSTKTLSPAAYELYTKVQRESQTIRISDSLALNINDFHSILSEALEKCEKVRQSCVNKF